MNCWDKETFYLNNGIIRYDITEEEFLRTSRPIHWIWEILNDRTKR